MSVTLGPINERSTAKYTTDALLDEDGAVVPAASLTTATLTLYDLTTGTILNSRSSQNILNANNVTITAGGVLSWVLQPADNAIVNDRPDQEIHVAVFDLRWDAGVSRCVHEVRFLINNIDKVTA
jgi:hypothetical protein